MPEQLLYFLSDGDLSDIIAYLETVSPVDKEWDEPQLRPAARVLIALGAFGDVISAEAAGRAGPRPPAPESGATAQYGEYLVRVSGCATCHGAGLAGGRDPNPSAPPVPNITRGGELAKWSEADFVATVRNGVTPSGHRLTEFMPWKDLSHMTDDELRGIWLYLQSLPAK